MEMRPCCNDSLLERQVLHMRYKAQNCDGVFARRFGTEQGSTPSPYAAQLPLIRYPASMASFASNILEATSCSM